METLERAGGLARKVPFRPRSPLGAVVLWECIAEKSEWQQETLQENEMFIFALLIFIGLFGLVSLGFRAFEEL